MARLKTVSKHARRRSIFDGILSVPGACHAQLLGKWFVMFMESTSNPSSHTLYLPPKDSSNFAHPLLSHFCVSYPCMRS
jgi:hypothetical protein